MDALRMEGIHFCLTGMSPERPAAGGDCEKDAEFLWIKSAKRSEPLQCIVCRHTAHMLAEISLRRLHIAVLQGIFG